MKSDTKHKVMDNSSNSSEDLNDMHITKHAKLFAPMPNGIIMIPEDAFNRALKNQKLTKEEDKHTVPESRNHSGSDLKNEKFSGYNSFEVDAMTKINAVSIAGTANDPRTIEIVGDFRKNINYLYSKQDMNNDILVALLSIISNLVYSRSSLIA